MVKYREKISLSSTNAWYGILVIDIVLRPGSFASNARDEGVAGRNGGE